MNGVRKARRERGFTMIDNELLLSGTVTPKAIGVLAIMLSRPDGWRYNMTWLESKIKGGEDMLRSAVAELLEACFVYRAKIRGERGRIGYEYLVSDQRLTPDDVAAFVFDLEAEGFTVVVETATGSTVPGKTGDGETVDGKPGASNKEGIKTEVIKTESLLLDQPARHDPYTMAQALMNDPAKTDDFMAMKLSRADVAAEAAACSIFNVDPNVFHLVAVFRKKARPDAPTFCAWLPTLAKHLDESGTEKLTQALTVALQRTSFSGDPFHYLLGCITNAGTPKRQHRQRGSSSASRRGPGETDAAPVEAPVVPPAEEFDMAKILANAPLEGSWGGRR